MWPTLGLELPQSTLQYTCSRTACHSADRFSRVRRTRLTVVFEEIPQSKIARTKLVAAAASALEGDLSESERTQGDGPRLCTESKATTAKEFSVQIIHSIDDVDEAEWNAAAVASGELNPFVLHGFLKALEDSHSSVKQTGWFPHHILARATGSSEIVGCCPLYMKPHSYGEYVFDHGWAALAARLGERYYPKLQSCVPFSPVGGPRLMVKKTAEGAEERNVTAALAKAIVKITDDLKISSSHVTFNQEQEWRDLADVGFMQRTGIQYHWENPGYSTFEDFLSTLKQPKRKNIRQERKAIAASGLKVRRMSGHDLKPSHWDQFYEFYRNTTDLKWGSAYLTREFFQELGVGMAEHVLLVVAQEGDEDSPLVAGALNLIGSEAIYGRNWGCSWGCNVKHLHFEMCYYQAQEEAIARGLKRVEAGAQGEHKIQRGYLPSKTYSSHYIRDPEFRAIIQRHLDSERFGIDYKLQVLNEIASPYKAA